MHGGIFGQSATKYEFFYPVADWMLPAMTIGRATASAT